jgi:hypothetical protein
VLASGQQNTPGSRLTGNRERMGFIFDHDDLMQKSPQKQHNIAAWRLLRICLEPIPKGV